MKTFRLSSNEIKILTDMKGGCIASDRITVDGQKVGYAYREDPDKNFQMIVDGDFLLGMKARNI